MLIVNVVGMVRLVRSIPRYSVHVYIWRGGEEWRIMGYISEDSRGRTRLDSGDSKRYKLKERLKNYEKCRNKQWRQWMRI